MLKKSYPALVVFAITIVLWQFVVTHWKIPNWLLPSPVDIAHAFYNTFPIIWSHTLTTVLETTIGFFIAVILGIMAAVCMVQIPLLKKAFYPFLVISQTIPLVAVVPLLILWLGYGILPKIVIVILICFFPIAISLLEGLEITDNDLLNLVKSMGATKWQILYYIRFPQALPSLFAGLKIAATYSVMGAVVGEWLGASSGLGVYLTRSSRSFLTDQVFAAIVAITILSISYFFLIELIRKIVLPWTNNYKKE